MTRISLALLLLLSAVSSADAQYFGRNKVRYDSRELLVLQTPHFDIYYADSDHDAVQIAATMPERWYERLSRMRATHALCSEHSDMATTSMLEVWIDETEKRTWFLFEAGRPAEVTSLT